MVEKPLLPSGVYDKLKPVVQYVLPAFAALYLALAPLWDLPKQEEVAGTVAAVSAFLGVLLALSHKQYMNSDYRFDGEVVVDESLPSGVKTGSINLNNYVNPADIVNQDEVVLKVRKTQSRDEDDFEVE
jgi:hypothetical protein